MEVSPLFQIICFLFFIVCCAFVVFKSITQLLTFIRVKKSGHTVQAEIIDFKEDTSGDSTTYPAVVSYTTIEGEKIIATSRSSSNARPPVGKKVWIIYSPADSSHFYFQRSAVPYLMTFSILGFGAGMVLMMVELFKLI